MEKDISNDLKISVKRFEEVFSFTDMYITADNLSESYLFYSNNIETVLIPKDVKQIFDLFIKKVMDTCKKFLNRDDHLVVFKGRYFRCCVMKTIKGVVIAVRQMPKDSIDLYTLGLGKIVANELTHSRLNNGGLIIICGSPGNGKTTTSSATITKRLEKFGGMCITIEDPPEFPLDGKHGVGTCIQTQVKDEGFASSIKMSMRSYPTGQNSIMFVGEVRDTQTALEVLKASIDGRLVITTLHSESVVSAIQRIASLASKELGDQAFDMMATSFRIAIHQKLRRTALNLKMDVECLVDSTPCVNIIKNQKFTNLKNEVEKQERAWANSLRVNYHNQKDDI